MTEPTPAKKSSLKNVGTSFSKLVGSAVATVLNVASYALRLALGPVTLIAGAIAFFKTASFAGWAGVGKSLLVGAGTSIGGSLGAIAGFIGGLAGGGILGAGLGALFGGKRGAVTGALVGGVTVGVVSLIGGGVFGLSQGYKTTKGVVIEKFGAAKTSFNEAAPKKTVVLDAKSFAQYQKMPALSQ